MLRGPPAGGRFRIPRQKATSHGPLENYQLAVEEPVPGGEAALGAVGEGKEEKSQLRLQDKPKPKKDSQELPFRERTRRRRREPILCRTRGSSPASRVICICSDTPPYQAIQIHMIISDHVIITNTRSLRKLARLIEGTEGLTC